MKLSALGAGSDYSPFLQYLGISSMNIGFGGEGNGGEYHSIYDSYDLFKKFKDPGSLYGATLAKTGGRIMMRLGMADIIPMNFSNFYTTVNEYTNELKILADQMRADAEMEKKVATENKFEGKITGKVLDVCQEKGCWMKVDKGNGETIMVKFKDYGFFMPKDLVGQTVVLEGEAKVKEVSVKQQRHYAEDAGKPKSEIEKITQVKKETQFIAKGVLVL